MNTSTFLRRTVLLALAGMLVGLAGCNTVAGFGQDMDDAGHAIKKAAD
jgi:entericidin A